MLDDDAGLRPPRRKKWIHKIHAEECIRQWQALECRVVGQRALQPMMQ